ncbi:hypothetical protein BpHYR1_039150 [Brachionus plicatilis]|uniref:Uncharacterized protein n=1 Tax=Brachionus plicatilis TaxID=10195 RepID=A0A3M7RJF0_BRAPC|nr:hypothetical protein BpHYR1_039150 [Brachionus plicatilis]
MLLFKVLLRNNLGSTSPIKVIRVQVIVENTQKIKEKKVFVKQALKTNFSFFIFYANISEQKKIRKYEFMQIFVLKFTIPMLNKASNNLTLLNIISLFLCFKILKQTNNY